MRFCYWTMLLALGLLVGGGTKAAPDISGGLYLVKGGQAGGEFVVPEDVSQAETLGVTDIRRWIKEITGAEVPILRAPSAARNVKVFVGAGFASAFKEDLAKLSGNDGFAIRRKDSHVHVFGSRPPRDDVRPFRLPRKEQRHHLGAAQRALRNRLWADEGSPVDGDGLPGHPRLQLPLARCRLPPPTRQPANGSCATATASAAVSTAPRWT